MSSRLIQSIVLALITSALLCASVSAEIDSSKSVGGYSVYSVYLGVVPAEIVKGHTTAHTEATMHGGAKTTGESHHVMLSIVDEKFGLSVTDKKLEPMIIAGTTTYGNLFPMSGTGPFQVDVEFRLSGQAHTQSTRFYYTHPSFNPPR